MNKFTLYSLNFANGHVIPDKFTCNGLGNFPSLIWTNSPLSTVSYILLLVDPDKLDGTFYHLILYNIPATITQFQENQLIGHFAINSSGNTNYVPPCPPPADTHRYIFYLYAVDAILPRTNNLLELWQSAANHIVGVASIVGRVTGTS